MPDKKSLKSKSSDSSPAKRRATKAAPLSPPAPAPAASTEAAAPAYENPQGNTDPEVFEMAFPVVALGASAGGIAALQEFFERMPSDSGAIFIVAMHLARDPDLGLNELLQQHTLMPVEAAADHLDLHPNHVYVMPDHQHMTIAHGRFVALGEKNAATYPTIDNIFRAVAQQARNRSIAIVLSGSGSDGSIGLSDIKEKAGLIMAQEPDSALHDSMPRSAIATRLVDFVLLPREMPAQLMAYFRHPYIQARVPQSIPPNSRDLERVFLLLERRTGHDFSHYKPSTILRRIERRMSVHQLPHFQQYVHLLENDPIEVDALFRELLISVTNFFRDPDAFEELKLAIAQRITLARNWTRPLRAWVPACATGEEAYSIAIAIKECAIERDINLRIQIFATDIDAAAIETARAGVYAEGLSQDVSPERLERFFTKTDGSYIVRKELREMLVFAQQNVIRDAPFSHLDLISCRNLMIYLGAQVQKRVLPIFHYALEPGGILMLGSSETVGDYTDLFKTANRRWKIFTKRGGSVRRHALGFDLHTPSVSNPDRPATAEPGAQRPAHDLSRHVERLLLENLAPPSVLVNDKGDILYVHGRTGRYLEPAGGQARMNALDMAREGLRLELTIALRAAVTERQEVLRSGIRVRTNGSFETVDIRVTPIQEGILGGLYLVVFKEAQEAPPADESGEPDRANRDAPEGGNRVAAMERELTAAREHLQTTVEELQTSNEELRSTNEELQSSNEELASTNEELETSKEELQSVNEELITVNAELQEKIDQLSHANDDMSHLLASTGVGMLFLDCELRVCRFTPTVGRLINLIQTDMGRPITHIQPNIEYDNLAEDAKRVLDTLQPREMEVRSRDDHWYFMSILPYRSQKTIEGVVITFADITRYKEALLEFEKQASGETS